MRPEDGPGQRPAGFLTLPNVLSLSRALLTIPFAIVMLSSLPSARTWGALIIVVAALTDKLDGDIARIYKVESLWGRILDPLADKIGVIVVGVILLVLKEIPLWYVIALIGRDALILTGGLYLKTVRKTILPSNMTGKWAFGLIGLTLFLFVLGIHSVVTEVLLWCTVAMLLISFGLYVGRFLEVLGHASA